MGKIKELIKEGINQQGWQFTEPDDESLALSFIGNSEEERLTIFIQIRERDEINILGIWSVNEISFAAKELEGISLVNTLNVKYRWCSFYIDDDKNFQMRLTAMLDSENAWDQFLQHLLRFSDIYWEVNPLIKESLIY